MAENGIKPRQVIAAYASELEKKIKVSKVILFGSAARGEMNQDSDLDLIVLSDSFRHMSFIKRLQLLSHARSGSARKVPMDILGYTPQEAKELSRKSSMLKEAFRQGKVLWA
jgi:predicted nucleotidyltransferase